MGLAAPKNRIKLSHDPNNTKWSSDTSSFGLKIMTSQGWEPGQYLGAKDANHAEFHTEANASHIRVAIKDDNLGLGAKIGSGVGPGECTGLDAFQNLLGRLNGRDEGEMEKEMKSREDLKRAIYTEQRWGSIRFVKGGLLVGDKIQTLIEGEKERVRKLEEGLDSSVSSSSDSEAEKDLPVSRATEAKKSKKRKLEDLADNPAELVAVKIETSKKKRRPKSPLVAEEEVTDALQDVKLSRKKPKKEKPSKSNPPLTPEEDEAIARRKDRNEKKKRRKEGISEVESDDTPADKVSVRKQEKMEKRSKKLREESSISAETTMKEAKRMSKREKRKAAEQEADSQESSRVANKESTPVTAESSGRSTPMMQGRHAVRARNIAQKRLASMDVASLNQIFMIKS